MYITDFICTYKKFEDEESDDLYRIQYLQAFGLNNWNYEEINKILEDLFFYFKNDKNGMIILDNLYKNKDKYSILYFLNVKTCEANKNYYLEELQNIFFILFSFDLFDLTHLCLIDLFNKGFITDQNSKLLINKFIK